MNSDQRHIFIHYQEGSHVNHLPAGTGIFFSLLLKSQHTVMENRHKRCCHKWHLSVNARKKSSDEVVLRYCLLSDFWCGLILLQFLQYGFAVEKNYSFRVNVDRFTACTHPEAHLGTGQTSNLIHVCVRREDTHAHARMHTQKAQ